MTRAGSSRRRRLPANPPRSGLPSVRHRLFAAAYLRYGNATRAAKAVGYSQRSAYAHGHRLLRHPMIQALLAARVAGAELTAKRVLEELRRIAFCDARTFWTPSGSLKAMSELTPEQGSALAGFEALIKNAAAGDHRQDLVHKIRLVDKTKALEILARHFALLVDRVQVEPSEALLARLDEGRQRAAARLLVE